MFDMLLSLYNVMSDKDRAVEKSEDKGKCKRDSREAKSCDICVNSYFKQYGGS